MSPEDKEKSIVELLDRRWEALPVQEQDDASVALQKRIVEELSDPRMKPLVYRLVEDPEDHEELMRELIQVRNITEPEPYDVFRNTVLLAISLLRASVAESMREKNMNSALALTEQATALAVKINDLRLAEEMWIQLQRIAEELKVAPAGMAKITALRISEILEEGKAFDDALEYVRTLEATAKAEKDIPTALNLRLREAEILRRNEQRDKAEEIFKECIQEADKTESGGPAARGWLGLARISNAGDDMDETARCYNNALEEATVAEAQEVVMETAAEMGFLLAQMEKYESSWDILGRALNAATGEKDLKNMAKIVSNMWYACENLKKWGDFLVSLRTVRHFIQSEEREDLLGPVLLNFGRVHAAIGNTDEAKRNLEEAKELLEAAGDNNNLIEADLLLSDLSAK